jgi:hypothetical protein
VQVLEYQQTPAIATNGTQQAQYRLRQHDDRVVRAVDLRLSPLWDKSAHTWPKRFELRQFGRSFFPEVREQRLREWTKRDRVVRLHRPPAQDAEPVLAGFGNDLTGEARLANTRLPHNEHGRTARGSGCVERAP